MADERAREGGARSSRLNSIRLASAGLGAVTAASLVLLGTLVLDVVRAVGSNDWQPVLGVFALAYLLLGALLCWQVVLGIRSS